MPTKKKKHIVVIGGGTGTSVVLRGLKKYPVKLSAIVTTADSGGSSGRLRKEIGMAPPGDVRQCFVALNEGKHPVISHFNTRFASGNLRGHSFGNLFFAALWQSHGDLQRAVEVAEDMFGAENKVIPVTLGRTNLVAHLKNGRTVKGEEYVHGVKNLHKNLKKIELKQGDAPFNPKAIRAIQSADCIIIGPGNLFASLIPPLLVRGMKEQLIKSRAQKIYITNLMNQKDYTTGMTINDFLKHFAGVLGEDFFDYVIYNTQSIPKELTRKFNILDEPISGTFDNHEKRFIPASLVDSRIDNQNPNDPTRRTLIRHHPDKLAHVLMRLIQ